MPSVIGGAHELTQSNVDSFNSYMTTLAKNYNWVTTIQLDSNHMVTNGVNGKDYNWDNVTKMDSFEKTSFNDGMHLNRAGYTEYAYAIRKKFVSLDRKATWSNSD